MSLARSAVLLALLAPASLVAQYAKGREVQFTIRVENVSTPQTLKLSNGQTAPAPAAPLLWTITDAGKPIDADVTAQLRLWDAGTEVNEAPGLGPNQAPRQAAPNTGTTERGVVRLVMDRFTYPQPAQVVRVTVRPSPVSASR